jgi:hypothetical protein
LQRRFGDPKSPLLKEALDLLERVTGLHIFSSLEMWQAMRLFLPGQQRRR